MAKSLPGNNIYVYAHWQGMNAPELMGILKATPGRTELIFSFNYNEEWLVQEHGFYLDPNLQLFSGPQYPAAGKPNFGIFLDSSPDRWGKLLMRRREAAWARLEGRKEKVLNEMDYLLGVFDGHRMGGLRFKKDPEGNFLNDNIEMASPPWAKLRDLEYASLQLENVDAADDPEYMKWLSILIAPGSSLGGARPKASVIDLNGALWIAKFPSHGDERNMGAWELVVHELALNCGVHMAEGKAQKFNSRHHTFLNKRFDRIGKGDRIHFASAMTLLGYKDGADYKEGASYLELAELIERFGAEPTADLQQLWRRIVFYICISNTDDHLRNHGFLLTPKGWVLSPAYDVNPEPYGKGLTLNISENDNALSLDLAIEVARYFRLSKTEALRIITEVEQSVLEWKAIASALKIPGAEQELMAAAFL
ncbi:MAG: HipA domain-containing protein [Ferruginibacter sp.]